MNEQDQDEEQAELLVRMGLELNKVIPKFDPNQLFALVTAAERGKVTWTQIANLMDATLAITFALERSTQQQSNNDQESVIDPNAYGLTI